MPSKKIRATLTKKSATEIEKALNIRKETFSDWNIDQLKIVSGR